MTDRCNRRVFLGYAGCTVGTVTVYGISPLAVPGAPEASNTAPARFPVDIGPGESWEIDDMWGHSPRYAHPIPHAWTQHLPLCLESAEPIDWQWVG